MRVVIVEDEMLAAQRLQTLLHQYDPAIEIEACLESIEESVIYLQTRHLPDLLFADIQLSDGNSFDIFTRLAYNKPIIFVTAYDEYAVEAFKLFSIAYILKPVTLEGIAQAINKFKQLAETFLPIDYSKILTKLVNLREPYKTRFLSRIGQRLFFVSTTDIAFFIAENKVVYLVDTEGKKYIVDYTIEKLATILDPGTFFRLNRKCLVHVSAIRQVKPYLNSRFILAVKGWPESEEFVISRDRVRDFRKWADGIDGGE